MPKSINDKKTSTFTVLITDEYGQETIELNTNVISDMIDAGGEGLPGVELNKDAKLLAAALGIPESQALEAIEQIEFAMNDGQCDQSDFNAILGSESMYGQSSNNEIHCNWALVRNKSEPYMTVDELDIYDRLCVRTKDDYLYELSNKNAGMKP